MLASESCSPFSEAGVCPGLTWVTADLLTLSSVSPLLEGQCDRQGRCHECGDVCLFSHCIDPASGTQRCSINILNEAINE